MLILTRPDYEGAISHIRYLLESRLPPNSPYYKGGELPYHGMGHMYDVEQTALKIAEEEDRLRGHGFGEEDRNIIRLGAWGHDLGLIRTFKDHEEAGRGILNDILPGHGFTGGRKELMCEMPIATKLFSEPGLFQNPRNLYECIICDSDVFNFGRTGPDDGFFPLAHRNKEELELLEGKKTSLRDFYRGAARLQESHEYLSEGGISLGEEGKGKNKKELGLRIERLADIYLEGDRRELEGLYMGGERFELPGYHEKKLVKMPASAH